MRAFVFISLISSDFSIYTSVLPHMTRSANFSDFVLDFVCRAVPGAVVCDLFARLPNVHEPVWSCVSQGSFNSFFLESQSKYEAQV